MDVEVGMEGLVTAREQSCVDRLKILRVHEGTSWTELQPLTDSPSTYSDMQQLYTLILPNKDIT